MYEASPPANPDFTIIAAKQHRFLCLLNTKHLHWQLLFSTLKPTEQKSRMQAEWEENVRRAAYLPSLVSIRLSPLSKPRPATGWPDIRPDLAH
jgi:hypothetical protein